MTPRPSTIETPRLRLVALVPAEIEALVAGDAEAASRSAGARFPAGWPDDAETRDGLPWHLRHLIEDPTQAAWRVRIIVERATGAVVGAINLKGPPGGAGDVEMGWGVVEARRRQGMAVEAAAAVIAWALSQPDVKTISAAVPHGHVASERVATRLGMVRTAHARRGLPLWRHASLVPGATER